MTRPNTPLNPALAGPFLMIAAGAMFAVINTMIQHGAMNLGIASTRLAFWQYLFAFLFTLPLLVKQGLGVLKTQHIWQHLFRVGLAVIGVQLWVSGLAYVPIWQAIALIMLSPFFVTAGAGLLLREAVSSERWLAVVAGFAGGMIILAPWSDAFTWHALLPVGAAAFWAFSSLMTKHMTATESPTSLTVYLLLLLTPVNAVLAMGGGLVPDAGAPLMLLVGAGVLTALAQYALAKAYSIADAAYLQPFDYVKLPFNVGLGLLVFGFVPPGSLWLGAALIVGASFFLMSREAKLQAA